MSRSAFACLPLQRKQLGISTMHERLALDEGMIHDIKVSSLLSYVSAGSQPNNFTCRTSSCIKIHALINNFSHSLIIFNGPSPPRRAQQLSQLTCEDDWQFENAPKVKLLMNLYEFVFILRHTHEYIMRNDRSLGLGGPGLPCLVY